MTDINLLKSYMIRKGLTQVDTSRFLGLSVNGFHKKLHNVSYFNSKEIEMLCEKLEINNKDEVFFA